MARRGDDMGGRGERQMQLKIIKADGSIEGYLHTKVIGTISNALADIEQEDVCAAEQLSDVVTYFLYHKRKSRSVTSSEIFSIIKAILSGTGYEKAAIALSEHHCQRALKRSRVEVASVDIRELSDAELFCEAGELADKSCWDKSKIVDYLTTEHGCSRQTARAIASIVEEKVLNMGIALMPGSLIKQLVLNDAAKILQAERQLQMV